MLAWDWLYEWMIKQAAQAGFYMTSSPNITGFFYNSENRFVKWREETIENIYTFPLQIKWLMNRIIIKAFQTMTIAQKNFLQELLLQLLHWALKWLSCGNILEVKILNTSCVSNSKLYIKVINIGSDTFGNPIFQKGLQN